MLFHEESTKMQHKTIGEQRRQLLKWTAAGVVATGANAIFPRLSAQTTPPPASEPIDWSLRLIDSTLKRKPDPTKFGVWGYPQGLYLFGQYLVYRRTGEQALLNYISAYVDTHVFESGELDIPIEALDNVLAANLLMPLYEETDNPRYKLAADKFRHRFDTYPRTTDGGFWHGNRTERASQLWLDGNYMAIPFLLRYGRTFGDSKYCNEEAVRQLLVYHEHLTSDRHGLLYHAFDESGKASWADPVTHHSAHFWCRAIGWYGMTLVDTLDVLPHDHEGRAELITILQELIAGLALYQDRLTGLWYQIVDQPELEGNWTETSSSSMFTYIIDVAIKRGYVARSYRAAAQHGYKGVMSRLSVGEDGLTNLTEICTGTNVGDLAWYLARPRMANDLHGLGAFLLMNEEWNTSVSSMKFHA
jgi:unsaturated rhamnogalacturonyl hydrolase